jgi:hypothetical protein
VDASRLGRLLVCSLVFALASQAHAAAPPQPRLDCDGNPLPAGAIARLETLRGIETVAFTSDGRAVVTFGAYGVRRWDALTGRRHELEDMPGGRIVALTPAGERITTKDGKLYHWRAGTEELIRSWDGSEEKITDAVVSQDGKRLATGGVDRILHVWDVRTGKEIWRYPDKGQERDPIHPLTFSMDGKVVAFAVKGYTSRSSWSVFVFEIPSGTRLKRIDVNAPQAVALSPNFRYLAHQGYEKADHYPVCLSAMARSPQPRSVSLPQTVGLLPFTFSADERLLAASTPDREVVLFESASGKEITRFRSYRDLTFRGDFKFQQVNPKLAFSPDGRLLLTAGIRSSLVWDLTGRAPDGALRPAAFGSRDIENLWRDLASQDASRAWRAAWALIAAPRQAVGFLAMHLKTAKGLPARLESLIEQLDSDEFETRQKAMAALEKMEDDAAPALVRAWRSASSVEVRHRASRLLSRLDGPMTNVDKLREVRAVHVLEQIATPETRVLLRRLEGHGGQTRLGQEAKAALQRLARRPAR